MENYEAADKLKDIRFAIAELRYHGAGPTEKEYRQPINKKYDEYMDALALAINVLYAKGEG